MYVGLDRIRHTATRTATHGNTPDLGFFECILGSMESDTLQHVLQHTATHLFKGFLSVYRVLCNETARFRGQRCSVLQCVAVCCSVLQCGAVCYSVLPCVAVCCSVLRSVAVCCCVL